jgi:hypothetical protein
MDALQKVQCIIALNGEFGDQPEIILFIFRGNTKLAF